MAQNPQSALATWRERLEYFQRQLAIASDGGQKFEMSKQIEECRQQIKELETQTISLTQVDRSHTDEPRLPGAKMGNVAPNAQGSNIVGGETIFGNTFVGTQNNPTNIYPQAPPPLPTGTPSNLPYSGVPEDRFFGRDDTLTELHKQLQRNNQLAICAVSGMGGIGKTELAVQYALRYRDEYQGGLCWLSCRESKIETQIVSYGRSLLGLVMPDELDLSGQVRYCWQSWREGTVLVICDDVIDYKEITPYLPPRDKAQFKVLMTSRQKAGANYKSIELDVLDEGAALDLLRSLVGGERIDAELEKAEVLCEWLGYLPLGIEVVGWYLAGNRALTLETVQKRLNGKSITAKALIERKKGDTTAQLGVAAAFELSWSELSELGKELGCRLSLLASAPIQWSLIEQCVIKTEGKEEREEKQEELEEVRNQELIERNLLQINENNEYQLHPLIREFFRAKQEEIQNIEECKRDLCRVIVAIAKEIPETVTLSTIICNGSNLI